MPSTTFLNESFDDAIIQRVWEKGRPAPGFDPSVWRYDSAGTPMRRDLYGKSVKHGWEVDHIIPIARGGSDHLENLQPLQWENNRRKGDNYPWLW